MDHKTMAAISVQMQADDYIVPYYRDRALVLGRGVSSRQLASDYFAKAKSESHGRQMPSHYSCAEKHVWSVPTPTGSQLLPACGIAWGIQLDAKKAAVVTTVGDAATRQGASTPEEYAKLDNEIKERIRREFLEAEKEQDPAAEELYLELTGEFPRLTDEILPPGKYRIGDTINKTLRLGLERDKRRIIFGEDIEDPKGGVFRLTQKLSTEFPQQVFNSPLAESTILGVACGLGSYGKRPV